MLESDIVYESGRYWVWKDKRLFKPMRNTGVIAESLGEAYADKSLAIARVDYLVRREQQQTRVLVSEKADKGE